MLQRCVPMCVARVQALANKLAWGSLKAGSFGFALYPVLRDCYEDDTVVQKC